MKEGVDIPKPNSKTSIHSLSKEDLKELMREQFTNMVKEQVGMQKKQLFVSYISVALSAVLLTYIVMKRKK